MLYRLALCLLLCTFPVTVVIGADQSANENAGFFLAIGGINGEADDGHKLEGQFGTVYISDNGRDWKQVFKGGPVKEGFNHANNNMLRCATYGKGMFVLTGNPKAVVVSENGKDWKVAEAPHGSMSVEFGNGQFLAPTASNFMTSKDGMTWTSTRQPGDFKVWGADGAGHIRKTVFGNGVFVCVGEQRQGVTKDGTSWLHHRVLPADERPGRNTLLFGNGSFVWLCANGSKVSEDGIKWKKISFPDLPENSKIGDTGVFDGSHFVFNTGKDAFYRSTDGIHWKLSRSNGSARVNTAGNGLLLGNSGWSKSFVVSDDNGESWEKINANVPSRKVYFFNGKKIIGQSGG